MDPYRDNMESRVKNLEGRVNTLEENSKGESGTIARGIRKGLATGFENGSAWALSATFIIALVWIVMTPSCIRSCDDTPEEIQASQAYEAAQLEQRNSACEALGMSYVGYDSHTKRLTCANENEVAFIDLNDGEVQTQRVHGD